MRQLRGRVLAVDADNLIWSFVTAMAATGNVTKGPDGRPNAHLLGLTGRLALFGAPRALRNLTGTTTTRAPELLDLAAALAVAGLTREELVDAAILIGTDYNEGLPGVGPVKAVRLVKKHGTLGAALAALGVALPEAQAIRAIFLDHPVDEAFRPRFAAPDAPRALAMLAARGFAEEPARRLVEHLEQLYQR